MNLIDRMRKVGLKIYNTTTIEEEKNDDTTIINDEEKDIKSQKSLSPMIELHKQDILFSPTVINRKIKKVNQSSKLDITLPLNTLNKNTKKTTSVKRSSSTPYKSIITSSSTVKKQKIRKKSPKKILSNTIPFAKVTYYNNNKHPLSPSQHPLQPPVQQSLAQPLQQLQSQSYYHQQQQPSLQPSLQPPQSHYLHINLPNQLDRKLTKTNQIVISYSPSNNNLHLNETRNTTPLPQSSMKKRKTNTIPFSQIKDQLMKLNRSNLDKESEIIIQEDNTVKQNEQNSKSSFLSHNISVSKNNSSLPPTYKKQNNTNSINKQQSKEKKQEKNYLNSLNESSIHKYKNDINYSFMSDDMINNNTKIIKDNNYSISIPSEPFQSNNNINIPVIYQLYTYLSSILPITTYNLYCHLRHFHIIDKICTVYDVYNIIKNYSFTFNDEIIPFSDFNNIMNDILDILEEEQENGDNIVKMFTDYNNNNDEISTSSIIYDLFTENSLKLLNHLEINLSQLIERIIPNIKQKTDVLDILMIINQNLACSLFIPLLLSNEDLIDVYNLIPKNEKCEVGNIEWIIEYIILICMKSYRCEDIFITLSAILEYL